jgi:hypothetical protein
VRFSDRSALGAPAPCELSSIVKYQYALALGLTQLLLVTARDPVSRRLRGLRGWSDGGLWPDPLACKFAGDGGDPGEISLAHVRDVFPVET